MRRYSLILGTILAVGGAVGAWVQAQDAVDDTDGRNAFSPPEAFAEPEAARPLDAETDAASSITVDPYVKPSAGTATPQVAARRGGGLAGRLQSIRRSEEEEAAIPESTPIGSESSAPVPATRPVTATPISAGVTDDADDAASQMPSVLKRPAAGAPAIGTPATSTRSPVTNALPSASAIRPSQRGGVSRPAATPYTMPNATPAASEPSSPSDAPATPAAKRPSLRPTTLSSGANASLTVETTGPKAMMLGKPATFVVTINNQGVTEASEVFVAVNLPAHVQLGDVQGTIGDARPSTEAKSQRLVWQIDRIAGRGQEKLTLELTPQTSDPVDLNVEWTMAPPMISAQVEVQEPKLAIALKGPKDVLFGETATYQIIVSNPGTGDAEDVLVNLVSDDATDADAKKLGTIMAGQQKIIEVSMTASQAGGMKMHFAAKSGALAVEASEDVLVRRANLQLALQGPQLVFANSDATYQVVVTNSGNATAENVNLGVLLPEGAEYLGGIEGAKAKSGQLVWTAGALAAGATAKFEFSCLMNTAGTSDVQLQAQSGDLVADATTTTKVEAVADLKLVVADPLGPKPVGEEVVYQVTITNRGTKAARKVGVVVNFSQGIEPTGVEGARAEVGGGQALFQPISSIEPGAELVLKIKAKASKAGSHIFRAEVRCTDPDTRLASEQTSRFFGSGASVAETNRSSNNSSFETDAAPLQAPAGVGALPTKTKLR